MTGANLPSSCLACEERVKIRWRRSNGQDTGTGSIYRCSEALPVPTTSTAILPATTTSAVRPFRGEHELERAREQRKSGEQTERDRERQRETIEEKGH